MLSTAGCSIARDEDRAACRRGRGGRAAQGQVVGLGSSAREDDLGGRGAHEGRHLRAGVLDGGPRPLAEPVEARGVAEAAFEPGPHRLEHARVEGRRGVVVEVDALHGHAEGEPGHSDTGVSVSTRCIPASRQRPKASSTCGVKSKRKADGRVGIGHRHGGHRVAQHVDASGEARVAARGWPRGGRRRCSARSGWPPGRPR